MSDRLDSGAARRLRPLLAAAAAAAVLIAVYLALGGASFSPSGVADPCEERPLEEVEGRQGALQLVGLAALDGAACELRVSREELALAIADPESRERFIAEHGISEEELDDALRAGLLRAVDDASRAGAISGLEESLLREAAERLPVGLVIDALAAAEDLGLLELLRDLGLDLPG